MPEGDSIHKVARHLRAALGGAIITGVHVRDRGELMSLRGCSAEGIEAVGKHLLLRFTGGTGVRVHLGMKGRWRRFDAGDDETLENRWSRFGNRASLVLATRAAAFVCFEAAQVEVIEALATRGSRHVQRLGPDLLAIGGEAKGAAGGDGDADASAYAEILRRARVPWRRSQAVAELLLDQSVASGIGNVYKSEVLFVCRVHPWQRVDALEDDALLALYREAARLMRANLPLARRATVAPERRGKGGGDLLPRYWVYGRHRKPCMRCGAIIRVARQGDQARSTYWCPRCQPRPARAAARSP
ncbi:DNA-formamidopyrimidine glycosylase family protein [Haliangium ochraceum]|uniref:DNA-(apurinic or apyrimidinic site) lyase n=1 Tax=Haliangium ochraceum (strain DSM 14365 / JCM 11303 / SMP-2) TaxID=502025 RepID=D0LRE6_HALO1|nr:DNA-formamidopyrimidine glycosylase family protein [Haliangium ochraceum]ACY17174.1 DNA glycosylase/AP lyase, H2TH DNA-binding protein [Haliangium ochraceum DSM 14365]